MSYRAANEAKINFDEVYLSQTPHAYVDAMARTGYEIGEQARAYCAEAAHLLRESNGEAWPVQMLDIGCSYGMGSAFVKFGCSFDELVAFFSTRVPQGYREACEAVRMWLNVTPPACDVRCVGLDSSQPAIRFGLDAGLLDGGIARNFEEKGAQPTKEEVSWFRSCNLMVSTGAIGYVSERTLGIVLRELGKDHPGDFGPCAVFTILRMFDSKPIESVFEAHGFSMCAVPEARLPQRKFADAREREEVLSLLQDRDIDTTEWEEQGKHFADLYVAAPPEDCPVLLDRICELHAERQGTLASSGYIRR